MALSSLLRDRSRAPEAFHWWTVRLFFGALRAVKARSYAGIRPWAIFLDAFGECKEEGGHRLGVPWTRGLRCNVVSCLMDCNQLALMAYILLPKHLHVMFFEK